MAFVVSASHYVAWGYWLFCYRGLPEPVRENSVIIPRFSFFMCVMRRSLSISVIAFIMLVLGSVIYLFFREQVIFTSWIGRYVDIPNYGYLINGDTVIGHILLYSLADALWYGALLLMNLLLCSDTPYSRTITYLTMALPFIREFSQLLDILPGTVDWTDIFIYLLTLIIFTLWSRKFYYKH